MPDFFELPSFYLFTLFCFVFLRLLLYCTLHGGICTGVCYGLFLAMGMGIRWACMALEISIYWARLTFSAGFSGLPVPVPVIPVRFNLGGRIVFADGRLPHVLKSTPGIMMGTGFLFTGFHLSSFGFFSFSACHSFTFFVSHTKLISHYLVLVRLTWRGNCEV